MTEERKHLPPAPPAGLIKIDDSWYPRRRGLLAQRRLTCIFGHRIKVDARPFEIAIPCNYQADRGTEPCPAQLYIMTTRAKLLWAMDLTWAESSLIAQYSLDVHEILEYFGVGFPADVKVARL